MEESVKDSTDNTGYYTLDNRVFFVTEAVEYLHFNVGMTIKEANYYLDLLYFEYIAQKNS